MVVNGLFDISLNLHLQCLRFCFFGVLQHELDEIKSLWNSHRIRHIRNSNSPGGCTGVLYFIPQGSGVTDCKFPLDSHDVNVAMDYSESVTIWMLGRVIQPSMLVEIVFYILVCKQADWKSRRFFHKKNFYKKINLKNPKIFRKLEKNLQPQMAELQFLKTLVKNFGSYLKFFSAIIIKGSTILFIKHTKIKRWKRWVM